VIVPKKVSNFGSFLIIRAWDRPQGNMWGWVRGSGWLQVDLIWSSGFLNISLCWWMKLISAHTVIIEMLGSLVKRERVFFVMSASARTLDLCGWLDLWGRGRGWGCFFKNSGVGRGRLRLTPIHHCFSSMFMISIKCFNIMTYGSESVSYVPQLAYSNRNRQTIDEALFCMHVRYVKFHLYHFYFNMDTFQTK
jgi:hypothetical protein